jgi:hypothetical protein
MSSNVSFTYEIPCYGRVRVSRGKYHFLSLAIVVRAMDETTALRLCDDAVARERERQMADSMW